MEVRAAAPEARVRPRTDRAVAVRAAARPVVREEEGLVFARRLVEETVVAHAAPVLRERRRQGVVGDDLQVVRRREVARRGEDGLAAQDALGDRTELRAARRAAVGQRLGAVDHAVGPPVQAHRPAVGGERRRVGAALARVAVEEGLKRGRLQTLHEVHDVAAAAVRVPSRRVAATIVVGCPIRRLRGDRPREGEPFGLARAAVEPQHDVQLVARARGRPLRIGGERMDLHRFALEGEVTFEERHDAHIARRLAPVAQQPERNHVRPPVPRLRTEVAVRPLRTEDGVHPPPRLALEGCVVEDERQRDKPLRVVGASFPGVFLPDVRPGQPVGLPDVVVQLLGVSREAVGLLQQLFGQPVGRTHASKRQNLHRRFGKPLHVRTANGTGKANPH